MGLVNTQSLNATLDNISDALFTKKKISKADHAEAVKFIISRQGLPGSYQNMFAPFKRDFDNGIKLFTGEKVSSWAATSHILGEETTRALLQLGNGSKKVKATLTVASAGMKKKMTESFTVPSQHRMAGEFCCGKCTVSIWRNVLAGGLASVGKRKILDAGLKALKQYRDGKGKWRSYPYYYTLLALEEINSPAAREEMRYAAAGLERLLKRQPKQNNRYDSRRRILGERVLGKI